LKAHQIFIKPEYESVVTEEDLILTLQLFRLQRYAFKYEK